MSRSVKKVFGAGLVALGIFVGVISFGVASVAAFKLIVAGAAIYSSAKKPKRPGISGSFGSELQLSGDPNAVRTIRYGESWTAGDLRFRDATGTDNKDFYMVIVLNGCESDSITEVEADRETLTLDGSGNVTAPAKWVGIMNVRFLLGTDSQTADATLIAAFPLRWTSNHRLRGLTYAIVKLTFDETNLASVPAFRFKGKWRKVYDARLDSTNGGSGSHRLATPSTWAWSRDPILCQNDYDRGIYINGKRIAGRGIATSRFDFANVIAEANVCEEAVSLDAGGDEDRYTCDGVIDPSLTHGENIRMFEGAYAGDSLPSDGKWRYFAGAYRTPTLHLQDQHFVGPMRHLVHKGESGRYDTAQGIYASMAESGTAVPYHPVVLSSATVGEEKIFDLDLQLVSDVTNTPGTYDGGARAQRIAKLSLEKEVAGKTISCTANLYGYRAVPGETILITRSSFGLSSQAMRVLDVQLKPFEQDGKIGLVTDLVLEAGPSDLYAWSAEETAIAPSPTLVQAKVPRLLADAMLIADPFFNLRAEMWDKFGSSDPAQQFYWALFENNNATVTIDLAGGSSADKGALVLTTDGTLGGDTAAISIPDKTMIITRGEQITVNIRLRRTTSIPGTDINTVMFFTGGRGDLESNIEEFGNLTDLPILQNSHLAALTLNQWYDYVGVLQMGNATGVDLAPDDIYPIIQAELTSNDAIGIEVDSVVMKRTASDQQVGRILFPKEAIEASAPTSYQYKPGDSRRFGADLEANEIDGWFDFGHVATRVDDVTFTIPDDHTADYPLPARIRLLDGSGDASYWRVQSVSYSAPDTTIIAKSDIGNIPTTITSVAVAMPSRQSGPPTFAWSMPVNDGAYFWCSSNDGDAVGRIAIAVGETSGGGAHGAENALAIVVTHPDRASPYLTGGTAGAGIWYHTGIDVDLFFGVEDTVRVHLQAETEPTILRGADEALRLLAQRDDDIGAPYITFYENDNSTRKGRIGFDDLGVSDRLVVIQEESAPIVLSGGTKHGFSNPNKAFVFDVLDAYADDTAAASGGVEVGELYRTASAIKQRVS